MAYKKNFKKLLDLKPNKTSWVHYKGFMLNRYDRRRLNKIIRFLNINDTTAALGILKVEGVSYKKDVQMVEVCIKCLKHGLACVAFNKDLWDNLLKLDNNYLTVVSSFDYFYILSVNKTIGEVTLDKF